MEPGAARLRDAERWDGDRGPGWFDVIASDRTRARAAALNQLLFTGVIIILTLLMLATGFSGNLPMYFAGVAIVFLLTAVAVAVPWNSIPLFWLALVPFFDIIAIWLIRSAFPAGGTGLLWVFPVLWLAASFGLWGYLGGVGLSVIGYATSVILEPSPTTSFGVFLVPMVLIAVGTTSYLSSRRADAQRQLLHRQAGVLGQALERSRRQEQLLSEVLDTVDFGVVRIERDGSTSITNDAHARLQRATEDRDATVIPAFHADGTTPLQADELPLVRARRGAGFVDERVWFGDPGESRRALSVTARRVRDEDGGDAGAVVVSRDVTVEMTALQARDALVASVSHELRTPLTSIIGYIELALDDPQLPAHIAASLDVADRNAERLLTLVGDVLTASSRAGDDAALPMNPEDLDVSDIVRAAVESLLFQGADRHVTIDTSRVVSAHAYADPMRLRQVVDNLVSNAVKYNREGGRVSLVTATRARKTLILVEDTGVGLAEDDLAQLFQRYYRGAAVRRTDVSGNGLGLSISRDIVRRLGGEITVSSALGVGSTFTVELPSVRP